MSAILAAAVLFSRFCARMEAHVGMSQSQYVPYTTATWVTAMALHTSPYAYGIQGDTFANTIGTVTSIFDTFTDTH